MNRKYTTIISDLGGVFLNRGIWLFWEYLNTTYKIPVESSKIAFLRNYKQYYTGYISEESFWESMLSELNLDADWKSLRIKLLNFFELNKDVVKLYSDLENKGYKIILLSDQSKEWWPFLNDKLKISDHFVDVIISAEVGLHKPDPRIYKYALDKNKLQASECIFVDDLEHNLNSARNLGGETILFENSDQLKKELQNRGLI